MSDFENVTPPRQIVVKYENVAYKLFVNNNLLEKRYLRDCFPKGRTLTYKDNGVKIFLQTDVEGRIYILENVEEYEVEVDDEQCKEFVSYQIMEKEN